VSSLKTGPPGDPSRGRGRAGRFNLSVSSTVPHGRSIRDVSRVFPASRWGDWSATGCLGVRVPTRALAVAVLEYGGAEDAELVQGEHGDQLEEGGDGVAAGE
jgi:hypothetical protein